MAHGGTYDRMRIGKVASEISPLSQTGLRSACWVVVFRDPLGPCGYSIVL